MLGILAVACSEVWQAGRVASDTMRRLMLLRHAKSDWPDVPDRDRPLAKRGRRDAPLVGRWLRDHGYLPDAVVCSAARRTRQTWELVAPELGGSPSVTFEPRAYGASAQSLLYLARELPGACRAALLIGHNPAISELATSLAESSAEDGAPPSRVIRFPTAAVAVLDFAGDWPALAPGQARLVDFAAPADLQPRTLTIFSVIVGSVKFVGIWAAGGAAGGRPRRARRAAGVVTARNGSGACVGYSSGERLSVLPARRADHRGRPAWLTRAPADKGPGGAGTG